MKEENTLEYIKERFAENEHLKQIDRVERYEPDGSLSVFFRPLTEKQLDIINKKKMSRIKTQRLIQILSNLNISKFINIKHATVNIGNRDLARLVFLSTYSNYNGMICHDNGKPIHKKDLASILNAEEITVKRFLKALTDKKILSVVDDNVIIASHFMYKGSSETGSKNYSRVFINTIRDLYFNSNMSSLSLIYSVIPYVSFWHNILCYNPSAKIDTPLKQLTWEDLSNILGIKSPNELKKKLKGFKLSNGEPILIAGKTEGTTYIYINPRVVYSSNDDEIFKQLYNMFRIDKENQTDEFLPTL